MYAECSQKVYNAGGNWVRLGGDTGETGDKLAGIVWEEMGCMGVQGAEGCRGQAAGPAAEQGRRAAGPAAEPPTRAEPVCFDAVETACGRRGGGFLLLGEGSGGGGLGKGREPGMVQGAGRPQAWRRSRRRGRSPCVSTQSKRPAAGGGYRKALPCMGKRISKTPKRPRSDVP